MLIDVVNGSICVNSSDHRMSLLVVHRAYPGVLQPSSRDVIVTPVILNTRGVSSGQRGSNGSKVEQEGA
ncbi:hypothetical protein CC2G_005189 [Coprinopsis cinerea AmutBmut pab1-1]|nr:hypothetical protein CC2G_005189 [Coprinopsis cinerea AmutBmut pab1-1]